MSRTSHRVVILGGGFGGLLAARSLGKAPATVTLIDRRNFHLFQPLLYQVATGGLSPANIAAPIRAILKKQKNTTVLLGEAVDVDTKGKRVILEDGEVPYDTLIVATGVRHDYFGQDAWEKDAPGLKTIEEATEMRRRILMAFERAEREEDADKRKALLTFVVIGGGPTGVELAGTLGEIARHTLKSDFRHIDTSTATIHLLEGGERILGAYRPTLAAKAKKALERLGVTVRTNTVATAVTADGVTVKSGGAVSTIAAKTVLWAAGVKASPLGAKLAKSAGAEVDRAGRVKVQPDLTVPGHPEIFVLGDLASVAGKDGKPLPGVCQVAMQGGTFVGGVIRARLTGKKVPAAFRYLDLGSMATIGRASAVVDLGWLQVSGYPAWLMWLFIHIAYLIQFGNRLLVMTQWAWSYLTWSRSARLITGEPAR